MDSFIWFGTPHLQPITDDGSFPTSQVNSLIYMGKLHGAELSDLTLK